MVAPTQNSAKSTVTQPVDNYFVPPSLNKAKERLQFDYLNSRYSYKDGMYYQVAAADSTTHTYPTTYTFVTVDGLPKAVQQAFAVYAQALLDYPSMQGWNDWAKQHGAASCMAIGTVGEIHLYAILTDQEVQIISDQTKFVYVEPVPGNLESLYQTGKFSACEPNPDQRYAVVYNAKGAPVGFYSHTVDNHGHGRFNGTGTEVKDTFYAGDLEVLPLTLKWYHDEDFDQQTLVDEQGNEIGEVIQEGDQTEVIDDHGHILLSWSWSDDCFAAGGVCYALTAEEEAERLRKLSYCNYWK